MRAKRYTVEQITREWVDGRRFVCDPRSSRWGNEALDSFSACWTDRLEMDASLTPRARAGLLQISEVLQPGPGVYAGSTSLSSQVPRPTLRF